jgi:hypothetical protein
VPKALVKRGYLEQPWFREVTARADGRWIVGPFRDDTPTLERRFWDVSDIARDCPDLREFRLGVLGTSPMPVQVPYFKVRYTDSRRPYKSVAPAWVTGLEALPLQRRRAIVLALCDDEAASVALMLGGLTAARAVLKAKRMRLLRDVAGSLAYLKSRAAYGSWSAIR